MSNFQTIVTAVFLAFFVFAVLMFSGLIKIGDKSASDGTPTGKIVVWGTFANPDILKIFDDINSNNKGLIVNYVRKSQATYQQSLIEAFASGTGPDLFFITPDMVVKNEKFIYTIPFASYPEKTYRDTFIDGADIYLAKDGVLGFPVIVDPMVLYYNKDLLANEGIARPLAYWDELFAANSIFTKKKNDGTILQSLIALGRYDNVNHAKDILATLLLQNGNKIVSRDNTGSISAVLTQDSSMSAVSTAETVMNFFVEFSNPSDTAYSWNRALPSSLDMFTGGKLVYYLGRASELFKIQSVNPNLAFDVTDVPQTKGAVSKRVYGEIYALAVNKKSANISSAFAVGGLLTSPETTTAFSTTLSLPPAQKTLLSNKPSDPYLFTFFNSAIVSRSWLDPNIDRSNAIFGELVQNILSNKLSASDALSKAQGQLEIALTQ
jgi:ABC-type glycerol-3-phosphate transport system substrate-binding protein